MPTAHYLPLLQHADMSDLISGFLNFTVGILCDKIRDVTARRLSEGDLTDEKLRKLIVRELDDIKCRLEGLARKDLLSSLSFFKEGMCRLNLCFQDSCTRSSEESVKKPDGDVTGVSKDAKSNQKQDFLLDGALRLSNVIKKLKIDSEERFSSAKKSFGTSREEATRAFNNVTLTTEDRIMASKLRIACRILEGLQDPEAAAHDCLLYIEELNNMPAVREIFSVYIKGGMKSRLQQAKRLEISRSIFLLNSAMLEFISKFTTATVGVFDWPAINLHGNTFHPILDDEENSTMVERSRLKATWETIFEERLTIQGHHSCAVNSKGEIYIIDGKWNRSANIRVVRKSGEIQLFCGSVLHDKRLMYSVSSLTVAVNDIVYLGICCLDTSWNGIRVLAFDASGSMKHDIKLALHEFFASDFCLMVTEEKIITCSSGGKLHFFDAENCSLKTFFTLPDYDSSVECSYLNTTDENDIIVNYPRGKSVNIHTEEGELKQMIRLPTQGNTNELVHTVRGVVYDLVRKNILVLMYDPFLFDQRSYRLLVYAKTGELIKTIRLINFPVEGVVQLISHPTGPTAVIGSRKLVYLHI